MFWDIVSMGLLVIVCILLSSKFKILFSLKTNAENQDAI